MNLASPSTFSDPRLQAIAGLCELCQSTAEASAVDVAKHLSARHGLNIHWKTIDTCLSSNKAEVSRRKRQNRWYYKPTASGARLVELAPSSTKASRPRPTAGATPSPSAKTSATSAKVRIFIGSSTEGLDIAEAIQVNLDHEADCVIWHQGVFGLSEGTLEALCTTAPSFDFAILVLTPDDVAVVRGEKKNTARDNVLLELGLFLGALGRSRTFIVHPRDKAISLPSDLAGITPAKFSLHADGNVQASLGATCTIIKTAIRKQGHKKL